MKYCDFCITKCENPECDLEPRGLYTLRASNFDSNALWTPTPTQDKENTENAAELMYKRFEQILDKYSISRKEK